MKIHTGVVALVIILEEQWPSELEAELGIVIIECKQNPAVGGVTEKGVETFPILWRKPEPNWKKKSVFVWKRILDNEDKNNTEESSS